MRSEIPDKNIFMMCAELDTDALSKLPAGYHVRNCKRDELEIWKAMPFDDEESAAAYHGFMTEYFLDVYGNREDSFYEKCLFVCDENDKPVATCFVWKAYGSINTVHWFKVLKAHEGRGIGRALFSIVMSGLQTSDYPIYLHTQPSSYRAIKLYSDFGFALLSDPIIGHRHNDLAECLPILEEYMPENEFRKLRIATAPDSFLKAVASSNVNEF